MAVTGALEGVREHDFKEKSDLSNERRKELKDYNEILLELEQRAGTAVQAETFNVLGSIFGVGAAIIGETQAGKTVGSIGHLFAAGSKFLNTVNDSQKQALQGKVQLLQEKIQDTKSHRQEVMSAINELDRAIREINSAAHEAQKQMMRRN